MARTNRLLDKVFQIATDKGIKCVSEREVREQLWSEYEGEKIVWSDFQRNFGYVYNLEEMTIAAYM